jgi:DNA-binding response OmpR family regulator
MHPERATILVVDDEPSVVDLLSEDLVEEGYDCITSVTGEDALKKLSKSNFNVILLDLRLPGISGMDILKEVKSNHPEMAVIVLTSVGDAQTAVEAMKIGAVDYIIKPFELERLNSSIEVALKTKAAVRYKAALQEENAEWVSEEVYWMRNLDSIANGVMTRWDSLTGHARMVINETVTIAQRLKIPQHRIDKWADMRQKQVDEYISAMDSLAEKLKWHPIMLNMTELQDGYLDADNHTN